MILNFRFRLAIAIACLILGVSLASGKSLEDRKWLEVRTENFRICSVQGEEDTIEFARHLEMFRVAASILTNVSSTKASIPINIYALNSRADIRNLGFKEDVAGFMLPSQREYTIIIRDTRGTDENSVIMHEYVHFLVRNHGSLIYPKWFHEGFAEYLSAGGIRRGYFEVGRAPENRRSSFMYTRWIPMRKILSPDDYNKWSDELKAKFYAEAWALVHYLHNRPDRESSFSQDMAQFLALSESGKDDIAAFEEAFGIREDRLDRLVKDYLDRGRFSYFKMIPDELLPVFEPEVSKLSREQASLELAKIALRLGNLDRAETLFTIALDRESTRPQAEAGLGDVLKFGEEYMAARPHFEKAIELAPDDPYCQLDLAEYWHSRASITEDPISRMRFLELARIHYVEAWKLDDTMPETYAMYGRTFLMEGKQHDKAIELLEEAEYLLSSDLGIRISLGEAYARAGRTEDAIQIARSVLAWSHGDDGMTKWAQEMLANLEADIAETGDKEWNESGSKNDAN